MKGIKKIMGCMLVFAALTGLSGIGLADEYPDNPSGEITDDGSTGISVRYTLEEFDALSDQEKREVYFNNPQQLPDNYESYKYMDIMHPDQAQE